MKKLMFLFFSLLGALFCMNASVSHANDHIKDGEKGFPPVLIAKDDITLEEDHGNSRGTIICHNDITFEEGAPSEHFGNVFACDDIKIEENNFIKGNVFAGDDLKNDGTILGRSGDGAECRRFKFPYVGVRDFPDGDGEDIEVEEGERLYLPPGRYGEVEVEEGGTLILICGFMPHRFQAGHGPQDQCEPCEEEEMDGRWIREGEGKHGGCVYFFDELILEDEARLIAITGGIPYCREGQVMNGSGHAGEGGNQVTVFIADEFEIGEDAKVGAPPKLDRRYREMKFSPACLTIKFADDDDVDIEEGAKVRATIIAPYSDFKIEENAHFRGQLIAESIEVEEDATFGPDEICSHTNRPPAVPNSAAPTSVELDLPETSSLPTEYNLDDNYPNPFNPSTTINYALPKSGEVTLTIYNMRGQLVRTLVQGSTPAGRHTVTWNGKDDFGAQAASGVYIYSLRAKDFVSHKRLTLVK